MQTAFADWAAFWHMGGYAFYVWASFGLSALVLGWALLAPLWRYRRLRAGPRRRRGAGRQR